MLKSQSFESLKIKNEAPLGILVTGNLLITYHHCGTRVWRSEPRLEWKVSEWEKLLAKWEHFANKYLQISK